MVLKRLTILCIGLILGTLLIASNAFCGTDDSGLQVFTLNGADMMGETADVGQEDTKIAQYSQNMFNSGNGLCSFPRPKGSGYEWSGYADSFSEGNTNYNLIRIRPTVNDTTAEIYLLGSPEYAAPTAVRVKLFSNVPYSSSIEFKHWFGGDTLYIFSGKLYSFNLNTSVTAEVSLWSSLNVTATVWQNRIFIAGNGSNYIAFSAAQDFTNFTSSATAGGVIRLWDTSYIYKLVSTRYGIYAFTASGIFLISGANKTSWTIEKISNLTVLEQKTITQYNDIILFESDSREGKTIWQLSGTTITVFCKLPTGIITGEKIQVINSGKLLCFSNPTVGGLSYLYDIEKKYFTASTEYNFLGHDYYFGKRTNTGYKVYVLPKAEKFSDEYDFSTSTYLTPLGYGYYTSYITLDGNAGNRKEIDRVEFDYLGGTTAVFLYYSYGSGLLNLATTILTSPINTRFTTYTWNAPIGKQQTNRLFFIFASNGTQTMTQNYVLKQIRIYYRNIGNYKTNTLR